MFNLYGITSPLFLQCEDWADYQCLNHSFHLHAHITTQRCFPPSWIELFTESQPEALYLLWLHFVLVNLLWRVNVSLCVVNRWITWIHHLDFRYYVLWYPFEPFYSNVLNLLKETWTVGKLVDEPIIISCLNFHFLHLSIKFFLYNFLVTLLLWKMLLWGLCNFTEQPHGAALYK